MSWIEKTLHSSFWACKYNTHIIDIKTYFKRLELGPSYGIGKACMQSSGLEIKPNDSFGSGC